MESISKFLQGIEEQRRKTLATRMQPLVSYLDQAYRLKTAEEQNQRTLGIATSDALERAKQKGYGDDEIEAFRQSLSGISDPGAVQGMFADFEQAAQAKRILAQNGITAEPGLSTPELVRLANESETKRTGNQNYQTKARELGIEGEKAYQDLIAQGKDPATAYGESSRRIGIKDFETKQRLDFQYSKAGQGGQGGSETPEDQSRISGISKKDYKNIAMTKFDPEKKSYQSGDKVYIRRSDGSIGATKIRVDADGYTIRWADNGEIANLDAILSYASLTPEERSAAALVTTKVKKQSKPKQTAPTKQAATAEEFLKNIGF